MKPHPRNVFIRILLSAVFAMGTAGFAADSRGFTDRPVGVSGSDSLQHVAVLGTDKNVWTRDWFVRSFPGSLADWFELSDLAIPQGAFFSSPWMQAPNNEGLVNLFALGFDGTNSRLAQWTDLSKTDGIPGFDSVATSIAAAQTGSEFQAVFAVFADGTLRYKQWDGIAWTWGDWSILGTGFAILPPFAAQVGDTQVNVYALRTDGTVAQDWWNGTAWSGWMYPSWRKVYSSPSSVSFDSTTHFLFAQDSGSVVIGAIWDGISWTALPSSGVKTLSGVTPVVAGPDSLLIYALSPDSELIRFPWSRASSWGKVEDLGPLPPQTASVASRPRSTPLQGFRMEGPFLQLPASLGDSAGSLWILDLRGGIIRAATWTRGTSRIPMSLPRGIYRIRFEGVAQALLVLR